MTLEYLRFTGRDAAQIALVEQYARAQGLFRTDATPDAAYSDTIELDLGTIVPSLAGPRRPQDRVALSAAKASFAAALGDLQKGIKKPAPGGVRTAAGGGGAAVAEAVTAQLEHGSVVIAAITSCTNTSNPSVMIAAGLVARNAVTRGLTTRPWVKTSLAPGSKVVTEYLNKAGLSPYLDQLGFNLVGYGCTTCIGNSGPLPDAISNEVRDRSLVVCSVLSGNRNFEGRIQQEVRANYLASPPLVVAYALTGTMNVDITTEPLGVGADGTPVYLRDIWPTEQEIQQTMLGALSAAMFRSQYASVFEGDDLWRRLPVPTGDRFAWEGDSTYIRRPPFLEGLSREPAAPSEIHGARVLALLGDSITTDHISPAGAIKADSPAGRYLIELGVAPKDFNSYGARRGNHEVMMRGTFANVRLRNQLAPGTEGGWTTLLPAGQVLSIYDASRQLIFTHPLSGRNFFAVKPQAMQRRGIRYGIKNGVLSAAAIDMFVPGPTRDDEHVVRAPFEGFVADDRLAFVVGPRPQGHPRRGDVRVGHALGLEGVDQGGGAGAGVAECRLGGRSVDLHAHGQRRLVGAARRRADGVDADRPRGRRRRRGDRLRRGGHRAGPPGHEERGHTDR
jgi:aconitate hydratase